MYESPITLYMDKFYRQLDIDVVDGVYRAVFNCDVKVDKAELLRALNYDRQQYDKGYRDGFEARGEEIVRCKYCKHSEPTGYDECAVWCKNFLVEMTVYDFCSDGEWRGENAAD